MGQNICGQNVWVELSCSHTVTDWNVKAPKVLGDSLTF
jgi:hypothetical protein